MSLIRKEWSWKMILNDVSQVEEIIKKYPAIYLTNYNVGDFKSWALKYEDYEGMDVMSFWYNSRRGLLLFKPSTDDSFNYIANNIVTYTENDLENFCQSLSLKYKKYKIRKRVEFLEKDFTTNARTKHTRKKKSEG